jgi:glycosyltransferase involved in cell wall biosynthesis
MVTTRRCSVYTREAMTTRLPFRRPAAEPVNVIFYCQDSYGLGHGVAGLRADPLFHYFSPVKATEYLAAGRPTVVADAGDFADLVSRGAALGYRPGDVAELRMQLEALAVDPALGERLSREGRVLAQSCTWRAASRRVVGAFERMLDSGSAEDSTRAAGEPTRGGLR